MSECLAREALEMLPDGVAVVDEAGTVLAANGLLEGLLGYPRGSLAGTPVSALVPEAHRAGHAAHVRSVFGEARTLLAKGGVEGGCPAGGGAKGGPNPNPNAAAAGCPMVAMELGAMARDGARARSVPRSARGTVLHARRADGSLVSVETWLRLRPGPPPTVMVFLRDVSALETAVRDARRAQDALDKLLRSTSHDVRTALNAIEAAADILREHLGEAPAGGGGGDEPLAEALEFLEAGTDHARGVVGRALDVSELRAGALSVRAEPFCTGEALARVAKLNEFEAAGQGLRLEQRVLPGTPPRVVGDFERLCQVLQNLVHNAVKFTPRGGRVAVLARPAEPLQGRTGDEAVRFVVCDTGRGIPAADLERVLRPFHRAGGGGDDGGSGLGLSIVADIVRALGGTLRARSRHDLRETLAAGGGLVVEGAPKEAGCNWATAMEVVLPFAACLGADELKQAA